MKIAIIGSGHIGGGLGKAWTSKGHSVSFAGREPGSVKSSVANAEVVVLAMPYPAMDSVLAEAGDCAGKLVIDCTNAVAPGFTLQFGHTTSAAEELQKKLPKAHVFKSFNAQGAENLENPVYGGVKATNFFCGDDAHGKTVLTQLVADVGFEPVDAGPLKSARLLEPLMLLWVSASKSLGTRDIAFKLLRR